MSAAQLELLWRIWRENLSKRGRRAAFAAGVWGGLARSVLRKRLAFHLPSLTVRLRPLLETREAEAAAAVEGKAEAVAAAEEAAAEVVIAGLRLSNEMTALEERSTLAAATLLSYSYLAGRLRPRAS